MSWHFNLKLTENSTYQLVNSVMLHPNFRNSHPAQFWKSVYWSIQAFNRYSNTVEIINISLDHLGMYQFMNFRISNRICSKICAHTRCWNKLLGWLPTIYSLACLFIFTRRYLFIQNEIWPKLFVKYDKSILKYLSVVI